MLLPMVMNASDSSLTEAYVSELLESNARTQEFDLSLTAKEIKSIIETRNLALQSCGRVDLGIEATKELIEAFHTSSFISPENYASALNELHEIFYYIKNETEDRIGDRQLIRIMKDHFENSCGGSLSLLKTTMEVFAEGFRCKQQIEDCLEEGDV